MAEPERVEESPRPKQRKEGTEKDGLTLSFSDNKFAREEQDGSKQNTKDGEFTWRRDISAPVEGEGQEMAPQMTKHNNRYGSDDRRQSSHQPSNSLNSPNPFTNASIAHRQHEPD